MEEEKKKEQKIVPQEETEEKDETVEQLETKEEPVKDEQPLQEESAEQPKEELKENTLKIECGIDYDKLAETIVRANKQIQERQQDKHLNKLACVFSWIIGICGFVFAGMIVYVLATGYKGMDWSNGYMIVGNIVAYVLYVLFRVIVVIMSIWTICLAVKIWKEPDRNYTVSVFSSLATFAALAVAILALLLKE